MYSQLTRFVLPLVLAMVAYEFGKQFLNGGMARMPDAVETLASYGLAWGIVTVLSSSLSQTRQLGLVLANGESALGTVRRFVLVFSAALSAFLAVLAVTPAGVWLIRDLHAVDSGMTEVVLRAMFWLVPVPILDGLLRLYSGLLIRIRRTDIVSYASIAGIVGSIVSVFALLPVDAVRSEPILLPILATYAGVVGELLFTFIGYRRNRAVFLAETEDADGASSRRSLTLSYVFRFFWPLALIMMVQGGSRPLVNLFVSRGTDGTEALATLTIVYTLAHLPYGWLNEIRNLPAAFRHKADSLVFIRRFAAACGLISFSSMVLLFWTPIRGFLLETLISVPPELAAACATPLMIFSFFPLTVMIRAYLHGIGLIQHRTKALAPSGPARVIAILITLLVVPDGLVSGATLGVGALLCGFTLETIMVWYGITYGTPGSGPPGTGRSKPGTEGGTSASLTAIDPARPSKA